MDLMQVSNNNNSNYWKSLIKDLIIYTGIYWEK